MSSEIRHRGPDDSGIWVDLNSRIGLAHNRLSIIDLSEAGKQPMESSSSRYIIAFNGEIYNHLDIRKQIQSYLGIQELRGHSDTETLLSAIDCWGLEKTLKICTGMFAFALWDKNTKELSLVRDRVGEKPLYYGWQKNTFMFASELKALRANSDFIGEIDRNSLALYIERSSIPAPNSIYSGIYKLSPGCFITIDTKKQSTLSADIEEKEYWSFPDIAINGQQNLYLGSDSEVISILDKKLRKAISQQMVADVPLGAFLSGGIDSSLIAALMQAQSSTPIKTFSIGFNEKEYNEAPYSKAVANHLKTDHTELYVSEGDVLSVIPKLPTIYDEPFSDSSQIPTFLISQMAKKYVAVALSGDAGDELFAGYNRHYWLNRIQNYFSWMPLQMRSFLAGSMTRVSISKWNHIFTYSEKVLKKRNSFQNPGEKIHKLSNVIGLDSPSKQYLGLISHWKENEKIVLNSNSTSFKNNISLNSDLSDITHQIMLQDSIQYLPDDILVKVDRASMACSLETRIPFLDHALIEFVWKLPLSMKIRNGQGKWLSRQTLYQYVPKDLIERPKMGFGAPIDVWLRRPLRDWSENLIDEQRLHSEGFFDVGIVRQKWTEHISGKRNWQHNLWDILMFQSWLELQN